MEEQEFPQFSLKKKKSLLLSHISVSRETFKSFVGTLKNRGEVWAGKTLMCNVKGSLPIQNVAA